MSRKEAEINQAISIRIPHSSALLREGDTAPEIRMEELFQDTETTEAWFAGVLEIGAISGVQVAEYTDKKGFERRMTQPYIEIHSGSQEMLNRLYTVYGGMRKPRFWRKGGRVAAEIVASTDSYVVARKEYSIGMKNWLDEEDIEGKISVAREIQGLGWQEKGETGSYESLLRNPAFVAGVLDSRGYIAIRTSNNFHTLYIQVNSKNKTLLDALELSFGGKVKIMDKEGTKVGRGTVVFQVLSDTHSWEVRGSKAINIAQFCREFLQTPLPEGWNYQRLVEREEEKRGLAKRIARQVRRELKWKKKGKISRISPNSILRKQFGVGFNIISQALRQELTPEEKKARRGLINRQAKLGVSPIVAQKIVEKLVQEVLDYKEGRIQRLSYREDLVRDFGISMAQFHHHVLPKIDSNLRRSRSEILKSQISTERNLRYWKNKRETASSN